MSIQARHSRFTAARNIGRRFGVSIGTKIILPYFLLTLAVAGVGAFVVTNLVASSLEERIQNQLVDAGQIVSEGIVRHETQRLQTLRAVIGTEGIPAAVAAGDRSLLSALAPQIIINSNTDAVELLDMDGVGIYGWHRTQNESSLEGLEHPGGLDFSGYDAIQRVLRNETDVFGNKRILLHETADNLMIYTASPIFYNGEQVGAAMVGTYTRRMMLDLTLNAVARVTFYDQNGRVLDTSLGGGEVGIRALYEDDPTQFENVINTLTESPEQYRRVTDSADQMVHLRRVDVLDQQYVMAFGDWHIRGQSFGMYSVALRSNFIVNTVAVSRSQFTAVFTLAIIGVFLSGFIIARRITRPINQLVDTAEAVTAGDLARRSGIQANDEIGKLSHSFDTMTETLAFRNRELLEKSSELEAIVHSIVDGVIVLDDDNQVVTFNPAAKQLLTDMSHDFFAGPLRELTSGIDLNEDEEQLNQGEWPQAPRRYQVGNRILSALASPVLTPKGEKLGDVIVLRDITREVEAENLKSAFITSISHELRTPLTVIKAYAHLMQSKVNGHQDEQDKQIIQNIARGSKELEHHINQLINISEIQAGTIRMNKKRTHLPDLVFTAADRWRDKYDGKGMTLEVTLPDRDLWINADAHHLGWAIDNLLSNALNYTPAGGHVEVYVTEEDGKARVDVLDNGIGVAAADQGHLFERFFRASNTVNYEARGIGLGLFITRSIVEMHNGQVDVFSEVGMGSTFTITLPLVD